MAACQEECSERLFGGALRPLRFPKCFNIVALSFGKTEKFDKCSIDKFYQSSRYEYQRLEQIAPFQPLLLLPTLRARAPVRTRMAADLSWFFAGGPNLSTPQPSGVYVAASKGDIRALHAALDHDKDADAPVNGWRAVHVAAAKGHVDVLELLLQRRYNSDGVALMFELTSTFPKSNALHLAAGRGMLGSCRFLVEKGGASVVDARTSDGHTALHIACHARGDHQLALVSFLTEAGADPGACDGEQMTPLLFAAASGKTEVFGFLVKHRPALLLARSEGTLTRI